MSDRLFVYGTLRPGHAPEEIEDAVRKLKPLGPGSIHGKLFDLGAYPGVILGGPGSGIVEGQVFALPDDDTLARLDEYEEFHPREPEKSLFRRLQTIVTLQGGKRKPCWVYVYNGEVARKSA